MCLGCSRARPEGYRAAEGQALQEAGGPPYPGDRLRSKHDCDRRPAGAQPRAPLHHGGPEGRVPARGGQEADPRPRPAPRQSRQPKPHLRHHRDQGGRAGGQAADPLQAGQAVNGGRQGEGQEEQQRATQCVRPHPVSLHPADAALQALGVGEEVVDVAEGLPEAVELELRGGPRRPALPQGRLRARADRQQSGRHDGPSDDKQQHAAEGGPRSAGREPGEAAAPGPEGQLR